MKTLATLVISLSVISTLAYTTSSTPELVIKPADVSVIDNGSPCMNKKISGKVPVLPKMKCRIS